MNIPVEPGPLRQLGINPWEQERREGRGDEQVDDLVEEKAERDLVDVQWEGAQVEGVTQGPNGVSHE